MPGLLLALAIVATSDSVGGALFRSFVMLPLTLAGWTPTEIVNVALPLHW
jgi:hypothetical protein